MELPRVITMLPSATEIVYALGYQDAIVARSHECDYPNSIKQLPACTESKIDTTKLSNEIDNQVEKLENEINQHSRKRDRVHKKEQSKKSDFLLKKSVFDDYDDIT